MLPACPSKHTQTGWSVVSFHTTGLKSAASTTGPEESTAARKQTVRWRITHTFEPHCCVQNTFCAWNFPTFETTKATRRTRKACFVCIFNDSRLARRTRKNLNSLLTRRTLNSLLARRTCTAGEAHLLKISQTLTRLQSRWPGTRRHSFSCPKGLPLGLPPRAPRGKASRRPSWLAGTAP